MEQKTNNCPLEGLTPEDIPTLRRLIEKEDMKCVHGLLKAIRGQAMRLESEVDDAIHCAEKLESCVDTLEFISKYATDLCLMLRYIAKKGGLR